MNYFAFALITAIVVWHFIYNWSFLFIWGAIIAFYAFYGWRYNSKHPNSAYQKWKLASFKDGGDPCVYSRELFDMTEIEAFFEKFNAENPQNRITLTHLCVRAVAESLTITGRNGGVVSAGHFMPDKEIDVSVLVNIGGSNLGSVVVKDANHCSLVDISNKLFQTVSKMRKGKDEQLNDQMKLFRRIPSSIMQLLVRVIAFISYDLGLPVPAAKVTAKHFGHAIVTNVSGMEFKDAIAPLVPICKPICVVVMNQIFEKPIVVNGEVKVRRVLYVNSSFDHRYADGHDAGKMFAAFRKVFTNPAKYATSATGV